MMSDMTLEQEIIEAVHKLTNEQKRELLEHAHRLTQPKGISGKEFMERTKDIHIAPQDLKAMQQAIEEWCERIDDFPEVNFDG